MSEKTWTSTLDDKTIQFYSNKITPLRPSSNWLLMPLTVINYDISGKVLKKITM